MLGERIKEIIDFAKSESPYRSANKGWITNDVFLNLGPSEEKSASQFDQFVKVSFLWQPIIQLASILFVVIFLSSIFAFAPISLSSGRLHNIVQAFNFKQEIVLLQKKVEVEKSAPVASAVQKKIEKSAPVASAVQKKIEKSAPSRSVEKKKLVTATDLFQSRHG